MTDKVLFQTFDRVALVTINRPEARNAIDLETAHCIGEALTELDARDDLSVGIITGAGGNFCAGMDLKAYLRNERPALPGLGFAGIAETPPRKPMIAAVEGYALGGGFEIALACDLIVASEDARFGLVEVKRGLVAAGGGLMRLPRRIPYQKAMEFALTGDLIPASMADDLHLLNLRTDAGRAVEGAKRLASKIAANGPLATAASKRIIVESRTWTEEEQFQRQEAYSLPIASSADAKEGALAFAEKRQPVWLGQ